MPLITRIVGVETLYYWQDQMNILWRVHDTIRRPSGALVKVKKGEPPSHRVFRSQMGTRMVYAFRNGEKREVDERTIGRQFRDSMLEPKKGSAA